MASTSSPALQQTPGAGSKADGPLFLSVLFPPIPEKLVTKIRAGSFVDMQELLPDNMALLKQLEKSKAKLREVKTLSSWLYCFLAYIAVATPDKHTRDLLTYARLVMREALRTGGDGWAAYDRLFREHAALDKARRFDWTTLDSGLHQATFIRQAGPSGATCTHCAEADHSTKACALASVQDSPGRRDDSPPPAKRARPSQQRLLTKHAYPGTGDTAFSHGARWTTSVLPARRETTGPKIAIPPQMTATTSSGLSLARAGSHSIPRHACPHFKWASGFSHSSYYIFF